MLLTSLHSAWVLASVRHLWPGNWEQACEVLNSMPTSQRDDRPRHTDSFSPFLHGNATRQLARLRADAVSCSAAVAACVGISATEVLFQFGPVSPV